MQAVRFHQTGGPEVLVYEDVADPTPEAGEVLIRVEAGTLYYTCIQKNFVVAPC